MPRLAATLWGGVIMNRASLIALIVIGLLISAGGVYWFHQNYELRTEEENIGFQGEARRNQYLAAERFLEKFDMQIKSMPSILAMKTMPGPNDVLFIPTYRYGLSNEKVDEIFEWVKSGGHLVTLARRPKRHAVQKTDELFERLGVEVKRTLDVSFINELLSIDYKPIKVHVNDHVEDKQVAFNPAIWMEDKGKQEISWQVTGEKGDHLLEYKMGAGWITLLSDQRFLTNEQIDQHDHASFLYTLVHIDRTERRLWIIRNDNMPSLWLILWEHASQVVLIFGIFLVLWLWHASRRFGPLVPDVGAIRRSMKEHIESSANYQWRSRNSAALLESVRNALYEQIATTRPLWAKLSTADLAQKLAKISQLSEQKVLSALQAESASKELEFTQLMKIFSTIRKKL